MLEKVIAHARNREYMSGIDRNDSRVKATGEVFTPTQLVQEVLNKMPAELFEDPTKTFCDPSCGDGQFLSEVLIRKLENGINFETALSTIYGVDVMIDNVDLCRERLLCGQEHLRHIVEKNIYQANSLTFSYEFCSMSNTRRKREKRQRQQLKKGQTKAHFERLFPTDEPKKKSKKSKTLIADPV